MKTLLISLAILIAISSTANAGNYREHNKHSKKNHYSSSLHEKVAMKHHKHLERHYRLYNKHNRRHITHRNYNHHVITYRPRNRQINHNLLVGAGLVGYLLGTHSH